ncbi:vitamin B12 dependent-methionine synthase activation domain-containing protein [Chloroflexota bacterium]
MVTASNSYNIDRQRVLHDIGYGPDAKVSARVWSVVNDYVDNAHEFIAPSFSYAVRDVKLINGTSSIIEDGVVFESGVIAQLLEKASKVAIFVLTIGKYLEDTAARLAQDGLVLQSAILGAIGSDAVKGLADSVEDQINEVAHNQGLTIGRRISPGYCDWDISQQEMVFQAMKGDYAGVSLTSSYLMIPHKSISGIIGIGPSEIENYNPCKTCDKVVTCSHKEYHSL